MQDYETQNRSGANFRLGDPSEAPHVTNLRQLDFSLWSTKMADCLKPEATPTTCDGVDLSAS